MSRTSPPIPERVLQEQGRASDPACHVWLSANAGSGKTHVLTERVIRLLLAGADPARIVCLTYTKAAAAVMQTRIFDRLSHWTRMQDEELTHELLKLERTDTPLSPPDAARLASARRLFARALETPGGLKIQTVHAFCEAILHQFPVEANIAGHFDLMDDLTQSALLDEARRTCLETIWRGQDKKLTDAFNLILARVGESGLDALMSEAMNKREALKPSLARFEQLGKKLFYPLFGLKEGDTTEKMAHILKQSALLDDETKIVLEKYGGKRSKKFVASSCVLENETDWQRFLPLILAAYYDEKNENQISEDSILVKAVREHSPEICAHFTAKRERLTELVATCRAFELSDLNEAAYHLISTLIKHFERFKNARSLLDFDDLIHRTLALLRRKGAGLWVQYKLDRGIEHILVDEAQDTSPAQWQIMRLLSDEFFSGDGIEHPSRRTIFAVGDEKQSIYSFQGALPEGFAENGHHFKKKSRACLQLFDTLRFDFSFRSTPDVLDAVDAVFSAQENYQGLSAENIPTVHQAIRKNVPGEVMVWQALQAQKTQEPEDWCEEVEHLDAPPLVLARQIAETIENWLKKGEVITGQARLMRPGDIMVLVRSRDNFIHALGRELKNRAIAVAGSDRLRLNDHIAIRDLMALARFVLQPVDDLSLACLLKSPLFGFDEQALYKLAAGRGKHETLYQSLEHAGQENPRYAASFTQLQHYRALADIVPVYEFYSCILSEDGGRRKILARLGTQASDVLDAFMDYTLAIQKNGLPGLQAFIEILNSAAPEIKREMDQARDEVRIMTVHAAKGLEAAVVFLVDGGRQIWHANRAPKLLGLRARNRQNSTYPVMVWNPAKAWHIRPVRETLDILQQRAEEEYRRLLYVGMTRAEDRLIVCGYHAAKTPKGSWLCLVQQALEEKMVEVSTPPATGVHAWRYQNSVEQLALHDPRPHMPPPPAPPSVPAFLWQKMKQEKAPPRPLVPSKTAHLIESERQELPKRLLTSPVLGSVLTQEETKPGMAATRGLLIHLLLQHLPDVEPDHRLDVARSFLKRHTQDWPEKYQETIATQIHTLLSDKRLARLFATGSRTEVSLMGQLSIGGVTRVVSGQIDQLAVFDDEILFADFKSGHVPQTADDIAPGYLVQMALYRQLLKPIYPNRPIKALLVYTQGAPNIFLLENEKLDCLYEKL